MRITKQALREFYKVIRNSQSGNDWEAKAVIRWSESSQGNIIFEGWNAPKGTFYNGINGGFIVDWSSEDQRYEVITSEDYKTEDYTQKLLEELYNLEVSAYEPQH